MPELKKVAPNFDIPDPNDPDIGIHKVDVDNWEVVEISMNMKSKQLMLSMRENKDRKRQRGPKGRYQKGWTE